MRRAKLDAGELRSLWSAATVAELVQALRALEAPTPAQAALLVDVEQRLSGGPLAGQVAAMLEARLPRFLYFAEYHRLPGEVSIDELMRRKAANELTVVDTIFLALLELANTTPEALQQIDQFEYLVAELATNPRLLAFLEQELISSKYDLRHLYSIIVNSATYQLSAVAKDHTPEAEANFASYPLRRLEAEVLADALNQITGGTERYSSAIPEPFTFIPEDQRSIALSDGSISSPFLEMFGRPPRDSGLESERNNRPTPAQRLHFLNSTQVQRKIEQSRMIQFQMQGGKTLQQVATGIYLGILSRFPTESELFFFFTKTVMVSCV